jgi:hypothetical protein
MEIQRVGIGMFPHEVDGAPINQWRRKPDMQNTSDETPLLEETDRLASMLLDNSDALAVSVKLEQVDDESN